MNAVRAIIVALLIGVAPTLRGQHEELPVLEGSLGELHHAIRTTHQEVQQLFDRGLTLVYAFNRDGARRMFQRAASLDAAAPMPRVGIALALGPNLNADSTPEQQRTACNEARTASTLAHEAGERRYAEALMVRYCETITDRTAAAYADAMRDLQRHFPDDLDAATLYADSLLLLHARTRDQDAAIAATLESVLRRQPRHVGANHYYIHAVEGSTAPERALDSARRLETLVTASGHLLHMPSHIYLRLGQFSEAIEANKKAAATDLAYLRANPWDLETRMYLTHDLESLAVAAGFGGRFDEAYEAADAAGAFSSGAPAADPHHAFSPALAFTLLRFYRWRDVVQLRGPDATDEPSMLMYTFAKAVARAKLRHLNDADIERHAFERAAQTLPTSAVYRGNLASMVLRLLRAVLDARFAAARGDTDAALAGWSRAVAVQDALVYHEPPPFYYPTRESLGAALFATRRFSDAEAVFAEDLRRTPGNGRSLFGLWQSRRALGRSRDAESARRAFMRAWGHSSMTLALSEY